MSFSLCWTFLVQFGNVHMVGTVDFVLFFHLSNSVECCITNWMWWSLIVDQSHFIFDHHNSDWIAEIEFHISNAFLFFLIFVIFDLNCFVLTRNIFFSISTRKMIIQLKTIILLFWNHKTMEKIWLKDMNKGWEKGVLKTTKRSELEKHFSFDERTTKRF